MIRFRIDRRAGVAAYVQLTQQVKHAMRMGRLQPGDKLPTAKEVVADTAINPNTVFKAYRALESEGLVEGQPGVGTFVKGSIEPSSPQSSQLYEELTDWTQRALTAGLSHDDIEAMVQAALDDKPKE